MNKALVVGLAASLVFGGGALVRAQPRAKLYRIGYLNSGNASTGAPLRAAFLDGLHQLGYVENQNVVIEARFADGRNERLAQLAADLVHLNVDVIMAAGTQATLAAKNVTSTIPIVTPSSSGLLSKGLANSLSRPGGNVTGISTMGVELTAKRLEVFRETSPKIRRLAVLWFKEGNVNFEDIRTPGQSFGYTPLSVEVARPEDFDAAFDLIRHERAEGLFLATSSFLSVHRRQIITFAANNRLPAAYFQEVFVEDGGLTSYSPSIKDSYRYSAVFVDKILKGAKPSDLPVEQPRKFELWFNLKTAKQIGLTIPPQVLARADRVIK